jgi:hypothetical protein
LYPIDVAMIFWLRRQIAGVLSWVGKVTLLFTLAVTGIGVAVYLFTRIDTGAWPDTIVLGDPLRDTLREIGIEVPAPSWVVLQEFLRFVLEQPTWMVVLPCGLSVGLVLLTWGDAMERSIRSKLRHQELMRGRMHG